MDIKETKEITVKIGLNEEKLPVQILWDAQDGRGPVNDSKAFMMSLFDRDTKDTLKIELWTKDFQVNEMDRFVYHTIRSLADTYQRATQNTQLASDMQQFAQYFGEQTEIIPKK